MKNLKTRVGSLVLKNPLILASGTCGYGDAYEDFFPLEKMGAVVTKGISLKPRAGNPPPRLWETESGLLNSIGLENVGWEKFVKEKLPLLRRQKACVAVNLFGELEEEYVELAYLSGKEKGISALELNLSCPNVKKGGLEFGRDAQAVKGIVSAVKAGVRIPIWVKLSASRSDPAELAKAAEDAGADAVVISNTLRGMAIDLEKKKPALGGITGGLSGPTIKPVALAAVYEAVKAVKIPVIACGGVSSGKDALEFLLVGARAVEVGTAAMVNPLAPLEMLKEIEDYLSGLGLKSIEQWIGTLNPG